MPHFYRSGRHLLRLFLVLMIGMALSGWLYAERNWQFTLDIFQVSTLTGDFDWLEFAADFVESSIEIFQGATGRS